jgi:hypothetical protein
MHCSSLISQAVLDLLLPAPAAARGTAILFHVKHALALRISTLPKGFPVGRTTSSSCDRWRVNPNNYCRPEENRGATRHDGTLAGLG